MVDWQWRNIMTQTEIQGINTQLEISHTDFGVIDNTKY